jgi:exopolysaccharide biosynthesis WecB/TagA/CpsF family protein
VCQTVGRKLSFRLARPAKRNPLKKIDVFGFPLLSSNFTDAASFVASTLEVTNTHPRIGCHINANNLERLLQLPWLLSALKSEATLFMDGIGVKLAMACLGKGWNSDINGTDLFPLVMNQVQDRGASLFLLGGESRIAETAARNIENRWRVRIAGFHDGYFSKEVEPRICETINQSGADVLLVGRGCPLQEEFVIRNRSSIRVKLIWAVGGLFDFLAGKLTRAPSSWRKARLEWLFRWFVEPRAKAHRTWVLFPRFLLRSAGLRLVSSLRHQSPPLRSVPQPSSATSATSTVPLLQILPTKAPMKSVKSGTSISTIARTAATELLARGYAAPPYLIIFVSDRCWMKCTHCWFSEDWKEAHHKRPLLTFDDYERLADSARLRFVSFTGGEAFRRDDIVELITMMRRKSRITRYQIPTSGYKPEMIAEKASRLLQQNPDTPFRVDVSLDGTAEVHDRIRSIPGGWAKAVETIKQLNRLKDKYAHFDVGVITTVSQRNQSQVEEISRMVKSFHPGEWMVNIARGNARDPRAIHVDLANYQRASALADESVSDGSSTGHRGRFMGPLLTAKNSVRRRIIADTIKGTRPGGGCAAGSLGGVIYADGAVHACELLDDELGNLHDYAFDLTAIWQSEAARKLRRHIQESHCQCTQECFLSVSMLIQPTALAGMTSELAKRGAGSVARALHIS